MWMSLFLTSSSLQCYILSHLLTSSSLQYYILSHLLTSSSLRCYILSHLLTSNHVAAQDIPQPEALGAFSDPYVRISLVPSVDERVRQSSVKRRTTNPYYNEYFKFPVAFEDLREKMLVFHMYDYDKFSRHSAIGEVEIDLSKVDVSNSVEMWCDIQRHRKVFRFDGLF